MSCPMGHGAGNQSNHNNNSNGNGSRMSYGSYLEVDKLLQCQKPITEVHDEHLFIITHQVYELWFKQIIFEVDSIRKLFLKPRVDETNMLVVVSRLSRVVKIMKVLVDQIMVLETMTPLDFMDFRGELAPSSGFQSVQFRLMENKLGVRKENRIRYNNKPYIEAFASDKKVYSMLQESEESLSLFDVIEKWLERTPGLESDGFDFWGKFKHAYRSWITDMTKELETTEDEVIKEIKLLDIKKLEDTFGPVLDEERYCILRSKGDRRMTWKALQGAMMISFYREEVLFNQPFQMLTLLMDIDSLMTKWRYNHVMLVQRQLGSKIGTGGTSGYHYLRSTVSDRYKVFLDLFNLSNYLVPRTYIPKLDMPTRKRLASFTTMTTETFELGKTLLPTEEVSHLLNEIEINEKE